MNKILVSIHCLTYNHEKFIADAIESFLMQETNFDFEILIHDDASTDKTPEIIKQYELKYPHLIKPIYQSENQYSKGTSVNTINMINFNRAKGKYIAVCEGDDYWIDPYKLQKQVDLMEKNSEYSLCVHGGYIVTAEEKKIKSVNRPNKGNKIFTVEEIIEGDGSLFLTNSMFFRKEHVIERPIWLDNAPTCDYSYTINFALLGKVFYIDEMMSGYRVGYSGSWTARVFNNFEKRIEHYVAMEKMLDEINVETEYKYDEVIKITNMKAQLFILLDQRKFDEVKKGEYRELYLEFSFKRKIMIFIDQYAPFISNILRGVKRKLVNLSYM